MDLKGATAIVTGSSRGVGEACVELLAAKGCNVVINYSASRAEAEAVAERCAAKGAETLLAQGNVAEDADCRRIVDAAMEKWGRIDALVNNAGTTKFCAHENLEGLTAEDFQHIYSVNVIGPYQMTRACAPHMKARGRGAVVNVSSIAGTLGIGSSIAYVCSKGALNMQGVALARVLGPEIAVNTVCPGFIQGEWLRKGLGDARYEATKAGYEGLVPLNSSNTAMDVAETIVWLIEGAPNVTGETIQVDSGMHLVRTAGIPKE
ncbi:SDR family NAD(P)-dependent oxidoreductase [Marinibaculum pumilum]|uniref:SDR family NAD(P)-dependent oxidoreductase n=1 Tax=Marinibaculum pumilum TaxID=1766165 RepID=A0ABV7L677_9PROT